MRELRFWDKEEKKMYKQELINGIDFLNDVIHYRSEKGEAGREKYCKTENAVLMQYTGLKDRNGREIYEGDILEAIDIELENGFFIGGYAGYVEWDAPAFVFKSGKNGEYTDPLDHTDECYVIGNIYENPELLEATR